MSGRQRTAALLAAASFLSLGLAYVLLLPPYEGFDETGHYSYVAELVDRGRITDLRSSPLDATVEADLAGLPRKYGDFPPFENNGGLTYRAFFDDLSAAERAAASQGFFSRPAQGVRFVPGSGTNGMGHHPPLYYALLTVPYRLVRECSPATRLLTLRVCSLLLATGSLWFWWRGLRLLGSDDARRQWLLAGGVVVFIPSLYYDFARLGNDSLACLVFAATFYLLLRSLTHEQRRLSDFLWLGAALGCGLLTKLFFVPVLAGVVLLTMWFAISTYRLPLTAIAARTAMLIVVPLAISSWWFILCYVRYGMFFARQDAYAFTALTPLAGDQLTAAGYAFQFCRAWAAFWAMFFWCGTWSMVHPPLWHYAWCAPALGLWAASVVRPLRDRTFGSRSDPTTLAARPRRTMSGELRRLLIVAAVPLALVLGAFGYLLFQRIRHLGIGSGLGGYYLFFAWPAVGTLAALVFIEPISTRWRRLLVLALAALLIFEASGLWYSCQVYAGIVAKLGDNKTGVGALLPTLGNVALVLERLGAFSFPWCAAACYLASLVARGALASLIVYGGISSSGISGSSASSINEPRQHRSHRRTKEGIFTAGRATGRTTIFAETNPCRLVRQVDQFGKLAQR